MFRYLTILLFFNIALGNDSYPYFSDMEKQLSFEQKKIVVNDKKESRQMISGGGSEFNWLSLISNYQPTYIVAPIRTEFEYVTEFSILRNGENISEIDFLRFVGLEKQADSLIYDFKEQIENFNKNLIFDERGFMSRKLSCFGLGTILGVSSLLIFNEQGLRRVAILPASLSLLSFTLGYLVNKDNFMVKGKKPTLKSYLTNQQVKSISEAYNRKLYDQIKTK
tara:strand:+ start:125 stop:793 length:669 start_codon:yes stop_codon:yes gene_type:complete